ncbi:AAC(3)-I family aminoglycoside N-acetyltransferase [Sphingoaurantiacus capsulatus]|uniref:AAC(3)-I family aminoglycoside N-acetyltransferase n=1 Tax=Sphingoaurantiacus capsulatus TaxID=1771310 RepID=A0ABV7XAG2_9SPHN
MPIFRRLTATDLPDFRALNALFAEVFDDPDHYAAAPPDDGYAARTLAKDNVIALVAVEDEAVVGGLVAYELDKLEQARSEIYIYDLAVRETHWRRGIATALIAEVQAIATRRGAWVIYVQADYGDAPAVALYTKLGVREDVMHFDIPPLRKT